MAKTKIQETFKTNPGVNLSSAFRYISEVIMRKMFWSGGVQYLLSVGVMLPLMAVLSAAWIDVDPESCTNKRNAVNVEKKKEKKKDELKFKI